MHTYIHAVVNFIHGEGGLHRRYTYIPYIHTYLPHLVGAQRPSALAPSSRHRFLNIEVMYAARWAGGRATTTGLPTYVPYVLGLGSLRTYLHAADTALGEAALHLQRENVWVHGSAALS